MDPRTEESARALHRAERSRVPIAPLSERYPELTPADSYAIQSAWLDLLRQEGAQVVGHKIGLTSKAMQEQLGVHEPDYGFILESMVVPSGHGLPRSAFLLPRIEPEIAFWLGEDLRGPGVTAEQVLAATQGVSAALELVDSRIENWRIKLVDTIADNASSARLIVGSQRMSPQDLDLAAEGVELWCDGERVGSGTGAAVLGHPANAAAWLVNKLAEFGVSLLKGQVVLPGAMCASVSVVPGKTYRAVYTTLGEVSVSFE
jgi:2-keto-4-pentenoate hydratase